MEQVPRGRTFEIIHVGGHVIDPAEVEGVILEMPEDTDVVARGEHHPILGQSVVARFHVARAQSLADFQTRMRRN